MMNRRLAVCLFLFPLLAFAAAPAGQQINWQPGDLDAAVRMAKEQHKLIYVFVEGDECPPCDAFKKSHLTDPAYVDFVNNIYVPIRVNESTPPGKTFLNSYGLKHSAVPRFYVMSPEGKGLSMSVGIVMAPPMGAADVLTMAAGRELPVDKARAAALAGRLRAHAASQKATGALHPDNPLRYIGVAVLEAQAWALAGRLDEAEKAFGPNWANELVDQEIRNWYINFWLAWRRNLPGALSAAKAFRAANPDDPNGALLMAKTLAANGDYAGAVQQGTEVLRADPSNQAVTKAMLEWRKRAGM